MYGNIGKAEDAQNVWQNGGEGIGLVRTEFLFMDRSSLPTEQEQYEAYSTVAKITDGKEVIIRTLDKMCIRDRCYPMRIFMIEKFKTCKSAHLRFNNIAY